MAKDIYGVKLIYEHIVFGTDTTSIYEEQIVSVKADSFYEAYEKAENYTNSYIGEYTNINGDTVRIKLHKVVDCFFAYEEENEVQEVYSGFYKLDDNSLKSSTLPCAKEDLSILRQI